jgi:hypothetical protein
MNSKMAIDGTAHLGIPRYLGIEVSIGQLIGLILLIVPAIPAKLKEWAYVGFGIMYLTAAIGHIVIGYHLDSTIVPASADHNDLGEGIMAIAFLGLLLLSYTSFHKLLAAKAKA